MPIYIARYGKSLKASTLIPVWRAPRDPSTAGTPNPKAAYKGTLFDIANLHVIHYESRKAFYNRAGHIIYNGYMSGVRGNIGTYVEDLETNTPGLVTDTLRKGTYVLNEVAKNIMGGNIVEGNATVNVPNANLVATVVSDNATIHGGSFTDCKVSGSATIHSGIYERVSIAGNANLTIEGETTIAGSTFDGDTILHYTANGAFNIGGHNTPESNRDLLAAFKFTSSLFNCGTVHTFCLASKKHNKGCKCGLYAPQAIYGSKVAREYMALVNARSVDIEHLEALEAEINKEFTLRTIAKWSRELR